MNILIFILILALFLICEKRCKPITKGYFFPNVSKFELASSKIAFVLFALRIIFIVFISLALCVKQNLVFLPLFVAIMSLILIIYLQNRK